MKSLQNPNKNWEKVGKTSYLKWSRSTSAKKKSPIRRCNDIVSKDLAIPNLEWSKKLNKMSNKMTEFKILWPNLRAVIRGTYLTGSRTALGALVRPLSCWRTRLIVSSLKLQLQLVRRQMSIFPHSETETRQQSCQLPRWHLQHSGLHRQHLPRNNECAESAHLFPPPPVTHKRRNQSIMIVFQSAWSLSTKRWRL